MAVTAGDRIVVTQTGMATARLVRFVRFATGLGSPR
jgi:antitoxin (DNA-binding transcriptional repressor) of toxin-antitoxin stability system